MIRTHPRAEPIRCGNLARATAVLDNVEAMRRLLLAAGAVAILVAVSGCDAADPRVTPAPTPSATPVFASDEEALAAAEVAYAAYLAVSDAIFAEGGADPERLSGVASGDFLEASIAGFQKVQTNGWRSVGTSTADSYELQKFDPDGSVTVYLCTDVSGVDVVDSSGQSVVSPNRPARTYFEVNFDYVGGPTMLVASREVWGDGAC